MNATVEPAATSGFFSLRVKEIVRETRDAIAVTLDVPPELRATFRFTQGQFLTFRAEVAGEELRRSYSICAPAHLDQLRVAIKRIPDGRFSQFAHETFVVGAHVEVAPPQGRFNVPLDPQHERHYLGIAAGSGITPLLSIIATTLALEPKSRFTLVYGNRSTAHVMFANELQNLKDRYLGRFHLLFVMSREKQDVELFSGRIDRAKCDALFDSWIDLSTVDTAFLCGPEAMTAAVRGALLDRGIAPESIKSELFVAAARGERRALTATTGTTTAICEATVTIDGRTRAFEIVKGEESVLDAGLRQGIDLPYSCKGGVCSTCRCIVRAGEVDMDVHYALEDYEIKRGFILTCQSFPVTDTLALDLDMVSH